MEGFNPEKKENYPTFDEQFAQKEKFELLGGEIEVVDIRPENQKTDVPVVFAPGWGETPETFRDSIRIMSELERRVISLKHSRSGDKPEPKDEYPADELKKALALLSILENKNLTVIDAVAHSEGAINTCIAASLYPEKFRNIILVGPGGLIGEDKFLKLAGRFSQNIIRAALEMLAKPETRLSLLKAGTESAKYIMSNHYQALKEAIAISETEIYNMIKDLHQQGIGISVIHGVDDPVFPMGKMQETVKEDQIDGFYSVTGDHNEIYVHPEKYIPLVDEALQALENKREQNKK